MRILVLNGSPHRMQGATGRLTRAFADGAEEAGASIETTCVYDMTVSGCLGCYYCWVRTLGHCAQRDDMDQLLEQARRSDVLVLATPVYCDGMTGVLKTVLDRMIPLVHGAVEVRDGHLRHPQRQGTALNTMVLISTCGFPETDNFDPLLLHVRALAKNLGVSNGGALTVPGGLRPDRIPLVGQAAREAGRQLVLTGAIPDELQAAVHGHSVTLDDYVARHNSYFPGPPKADNKA